MDQSSVEHTLTLRITVRSAKNWRQVASRMKDISISAIADAQNTLLNLEDGVIVFTEVESECTYEMANDDLDDGAEEPEV